MLDSHNDIVLCTASITYSLNFFTLLYYLYFVTWIVFKKKKSEKKGHIVSQVDGDITIRSSSACSRKKTHGDLSSLGNLRFRLSNLIRSHQYSTVRIWVIIIIYLEKDTDEATCTHPTNTTNLVWTLTLPRIDYSLTRVTWIFFSRKCRRTALHYL